MEIAVIGAGSHFTLALLRSLYQEASADEHHLRLMDIRSEPLAALADLIPRLNARTGRSVTFSCHHERPEALEGADHVLVSFAADFPASFLRTCWVLRNHGLQFVEGETATPGALMATLRHLPLLLEITEEVQRSTAGAWLHIINNPMPRLILGVLRGTGYPRVVGHCHGTVQTRERISALTGTAVEDIDLFVAGINHFHIVTQAVDRRDKKNLLDAIGQLSDERSAWWKANDYTQWALYQELGQVLGCGHWHNFDYVPYSNTRLFRHADYNTWERKCLAVQARREAGVEGEIGSHLHDDGALDQFLDEPEREQLFPIMCALSGTTAPYFYLAGNMPNAGHIQNLPNGAIVELPATVTPEGVAMHPWAEPIPVFFEAWLRQQLAIHELSVCAVLEHSRQAAIEAIACDPAFRDCDCAPGELLDEMLAANRDLVPPLN